MWQLIIQMSQGYVITDLVYLAQIPCNKPIKAFLISLPTSFFTVANVTTATVELSCMSVCFWVSMNTITQKLFDLGS